MTYCGSFCEKADLGFPIEALRAHAEVLRPARRVLLAA